MRILPQPLSGYSAAAASFLCLSLSESQAQTVYHDLDPDIHPIADYYPIPQPIDLDQDGMADITFSRGSLSGGVSSCPRYGSILKYYGNVQFAQVSFSEVSYVETCSSSIYVTVSGYHPDVLPAGIPITETMDWGDGAGILYRVYDGSATTGIRFAFKDKYFAFRLPRLTDTLYGWMEVEHYFRSDYPFTRSLLWSEPQYFEGGPFYVKEFMISDDVTKLATGVASDTIPCVPSAPQNLRLFQGDESHVFEWGRVNESIGCRFRVNPLGTSKWKEVSFYEYEVETFTGDATVIPEGDFQWKVQCFCSDSVATPWSEADTIRIGCIQPILPYSYVWLSNTLLSWYPINAPGWDFRNVKIRPLGSSSATVYPTTGTYYFTPPIPPGDYEFAVQSVCLDGTESLYSDWFPFTMLALRSENPSAPEYIDIETEVRICQDGYYFHLHSNETIESLNLYDINGRLVHQENPAQMEYTVDTYGLVSGLYILEINASSGSKYLKLVR